MQGLLRFEVFKSKVEYCVYIKTLKGALVQRRRECLNYNQAR